MNTGQEKVIKASEVVKLLLVLSHGQSNVERGFRINKEMEVENMKELQLLLKGFFVIL